MKRTNTKTKATAIALTALMAVSTLGAATVSAAEIAPQDSTRTIYFVNNKGWENVYGYTWNTESGAENAAFPGEQLECVGTTTAGDFGSAQEVYEIKINTSKYDKLIFSEGGEHGQQSKDFDLNSTDYVGFKLDDNNKLEAIEEMGTTETAVTTATVSQYSADSETMVTNEVPQTESNIVPDHITSYRAGEHGNTLYIDTNGITNSKPVVKLFNVNCTTTEVKVEPQKVDGKIVAGLYVAEVPQGNYYGATISFDGKSCSTNITDTTDSIKLANVNGNVTAETCQRVFFSNTFSTRTMDNQIIRIYSWNSVSGKEETSFDASPRMTYYGNNEVGQNMYFYDVPSSYDHIIIFSKDFTNNKVTTQTSDITLNTTVNTPDSIIMTGYYTTTSDKAVATYSMQVTK